VSHLAADGETFRIPKITYFKQGAMEFHIVSCFANSFPHLNFSFVANLLQPTSPSSNSAMMPAYFSLDF